MAKADEMRLPAVEAKRKSDASARMLSELLRDLDNTLQLERERWAEAGRVNKKTAAAWFGADGDEPGPIQQKWRYPVRRQIIELLCAGSHPSQIGTIMTIMGGDDVLVPSERFMRRMRNEMCIVVETLAARAAADPDVSHHTFIKLLRALRSFPTTLYERPLTPRCC